ncbi:hypothetical protein HMPREF9374_2253 [Desmospora sp. 8437]|nr:hypothetical protein HMPREF9374_2253 [Desmospora sp. 8437]
MKEYTLLKSFRQLLHVAYHNFRKFCHLPCRWRKPRRLYEESRMIHSKPELLPRKACRPPLNHRKK